MDVELRGVMDEVAQQLPWLESDEWLDERRRETRGAGSHDGVSKLEAAPHGTERAEARPGRARTEPAGYAWLVLLIVLVTEIAWCVYLVSLAISLL